MSEPASIASTMGICLIGTMAAAILYGITITQTYLYYRRFPQDRYTIKTMIEVGINVRIYFFSKGDQIEVQTVSVIRSFFAHRLLHLSRKSRIGWVLTVAICILSWIHFVLGIYVTARLYELRYFVKSHRLQWATKLGLGSAAVCDLMIAIGVQVWPSRLHCWFLYNSKTGYHKVCCALVVITYSIFDNELISMSIFWILGKCG
ncbi:hypothetical protein BU17DRAFT_69910 [Hysterangium stoloniferum]|nr:hypothetical protein BU17DRAFT_69910 [Hysterangium stoloniferum]